jgi:hypothetical protein
LNWLPFRVRIVRHHRPVGEERPRTELLRVRQELATLDHLGPEIEEIEDELEWVSACPHGENRSHGPQTMKSGAHAASGTSFRGSMRLRSALNEYCLQPPGETPAAEQGYFRWDSQNGQVTITILLTVCQASCQGCKGQEPAFDAIQRA